MTIAEYFDWWVAFFGDAAAVETIDAGDPACRHEQHGDWLMCFAPDVIVAQWCRDCRAAFALVRAHGPKRPWVAA